MMREYRKPLKKYFNVLIIKLSIVCQYYPLAMETNHNPQVVRAKGVTKDIIIQTVLNKFLILIIGLPCRLLL